MQKEQRLLVAAIAVSGGLHAAAGADASITLSTITLPEGNTILQVTDAVAGSTAGGVATSDTRTIYVFEPDFGDPEPNFTDYTGAAWPYVYLPQNATLADVTVEPGISATLELLPNPASPAGLQWLLVNGNPVYQFVNDNGVTDANGNFGPWFFLRPDGAPTQQVPAPSALALLGAASTGLLRRKRA